jgi:hypothetical protein
VPGLRAVALAAVAAATVSMLLLAAGAAGAAGPPVIASVTIEPSTATVGDRLTYRIAVDHDPATTVDAPGFDAVFPGLELVDVPPPRADDRGDTERTTFTYTLTSFQTGEITIPPQTITYGGAAGDGALRTAPITVTITSVLAPGDTGLRPLKPQLDLPDAAPPPIVPALFVAAFAALTALGYVLVARAIAIRPLPLPSARLRPQAERPAHETARAELDALVAERLADSDVAAYYACLAAIVRRYLSERFAFPAYAMTRTEIERAMTSAGIDRWPARLTANLFEQCDAAQFAGFTPARERRTADLTAAREIITLTTPNETTAPQSATSADPR